MFIGHFAYSSVPPAERHCSWAACLNHVLLLDYHYLLLLFLLFFMPTSIKPQAEILELNNVNGCNNISFGDHSILEGDRIPPLKSHRQAFP